MRRNKKTFRRAYTGSKRFSRSCRSHGGCPWCLGNRMYRVHKADIDYHQQLSEYGERDGNNSTDGGHDSLVDSSRHG